MGKKKKLIRFAENKSFKKLFEPDAIELLNHNHEFRGKWLSDYFKRSGRLVLELGCGYGEYTVGQARMMPQDNFIGIDIKGARLNIGVKEIENEKMSNACFVRTLVENIPCVFDKEVDEIWLTFPDPRPDRARRRLTHPLFLERYKKVLKENGCVCLKTDSKELYDYTCELIDGSGYKIIEKTDNLYESPLLERIPNIQTKYEKRFLAEGKNICFLRFSL